MSSVIKQTLCPTLFLGLFFFSLLAYAGVLGLPAPTLPGAIRPTTSESLPDLEALAGEVVDIPEVVERPFDLEDPPFILVKSFKLLDATDLPKFKIDLDEIQSSILDKALEMQPERGFSIGELQQITDNVTNYYRGQGLILSQAVLPVQNVVGGVVDIQIFVGVLGRILIEENQHYEEYILREPFLPLIGQPVTQKSVEAAILTLTDFPGLSVFGVFQPGRKVGEADIVIKIQDEKAYNVALRLDNQGVRETGERNFTTNIDWNSPTGAADKLNFLFRQSYRPKNTFSWTASYERFLGHGFTAGFSIFRNRSNVFIDQGGPITQIQSSVLDFSVNKSLIRQRQENLSTKLSFRRKRSQIFLDSRSLNYDSLSVLALETNYDIVDSYHPLHFFYDKVFDIGENFGGGLNFVFLEYSHGFNNIFGAMGSSAESNTLPNTHFPTRRGGDQRFSEGQFNKLYGSFSRLQLLSQNQSLLLKGEFQYTPDILTSLEQYSVGGLNNVRAFPSTQALFDSAYFFSVEYIINAPFLAQVEAFDNRTWGELLQFSIFYDFVTGTRNNPTLTPDELLEQGNFVTFRGYGMGLRFSLPGSINSRLILARQLGGNPLSPPRNNRNTQVWGDFTYSF